MIVVAACAAVKGPPTGRIRARGACVARTSGWPPRSELRVPRPQPLRSVRHEGVGERVDPCEIRSELGREAMAWPADWGPHEDTGRVADLSPGLMGRLGLATDDEVQVIYPRRFKNA